MHIRDEIKELMEELVDIRKQLHQIPELGFEEHKTSAFIESYLDKLNIPYENQIATTGIVAYLKGIQGYKTYCFRSDMDALTVHEETNIEYESKHKGKMHACGHDGHMTILLGLAKYLSKKREQQLANIVLLFQPAEEGPGGAIPMIEHGILEKYKIDEIYGLHLLPELDEGKIGVRTGAIMSQCGEFDILIKGKSGHGAMPHTAVDSITIASEMIMSLQTIVSRNINPLDPAVISIGKIEGGERRNIIAKQVMIEGTTRTFSQTNYDIIKKRIMDIKLGFERTYNCCIELIFRDMYPAVINDIELTEKFIRSQESDRVQIIEPMMISEDFSYFQKQIPGVFFFLGTKNEKKDYVYPLHNSKFNFDSKVLADGLEIYARLIDDKASSRK